MNLLPGERIIVTSEAKELTLTTHRLRWDSRRWGEAQVTAIMLDELCSCEVTSVSQPILLILAALAAIGGFVIQNIAAIAIGITLAVVLLVVYLTCRRQAVALRSAGAAITTKTEGMSLQDAIDLIDEVEAAKNARYLLLQPAARGRDGSE